MQGLQVDVADSIALDAFAACVRERFPDLNVLINNAGITHAEDLTSAEINVSVARSIIQTNIVGVLQLTAALLPTLRRQSGATVLTTTSGLAFVPGAEYPTYCASKAFLHSRLQSLRSQLRGTVEVLELPPPYVRTELNGSWQATDPNGMPLADYVAEVMLALEATNLSRGEILVERVKALRWAETNGMYEKIFDAFNGS
jgi:uncharacterized oxidoreductase